MGRNYKINSIKLFYGKKIDNEINLDILKLNKGEKIAFGSIFLNLFNSFACFGI